LRPPVLFALLLVIFPCCLADAAPADDASTQRMAALTRMADVAAALAEARQWADADPDNPIAFATCGDLAMRCGSFEEAASFYESALFFRRDAELNAKLGDAYRELGEETSALRAYRRALRLDDANVRAIVGTARAMLQSARQRLEARLEFQTALDLDPGNVDAQTGLAELDLAEGDTEGAMAGLDALVRNAPGAARAQLLLGKLLAERGDLQGARRRWQEFVRLEPARPEAWLLQNNLFPVGERGLSIRGTYCVFSPDGKRIAYIGAGAVANKQVLVAATEGTGEPQVVCDVEGTPYGLSWSPDGSRIAVLAFQTAGATSAGKPAGGKTDYRLCTVPSTGGDKVLVCMGQFLGVPSWMPDGKALCFDTWATGRGRTIVVVADKTGSEPSPLFPGKSGPALQSICWNRAGSLAVTTTCDFQVETAYGLALRHSNALGDPKTFYTTSGLISYPTFSPDGRNIVFLQRDGRFNHCIYAMPVADTPQIPRLMMHTDYYSCPPSMTPDGKQMLAYGRDGIAIMTLTGLEG
jgi:tetratricopeptide (TPR) repeat protein